MRKGSSYIRRQENWGIPPNRGHPSTLAARPRLHTKSWGEAHIPETHSLIWGPWQTPTSSFLTLNLEAETPATNMLPSLKAADLLLFLCLDAKYFYYTLLSISFYLFHGIHLWNFLRDLWFVFHFEGQTSIQVASFPHKKPIFWGSFQHLLFEFF